MNHLVEVAFFTTQPDEVIAYYAKLFGSDPAVSAPGMAIFIAGKLKMLIHFKSEDDQKIPPDEDHIAFSAVDLEAAFQSMVEAGATVVAPPRDYDWGRSAYLRDPDGRLVELQRFSESEMG